MKTTLSLAALVIVATSMFSQARTVSPHELPRPQNDTEVWNGALDIKVMKLRLRLELTPDGDNWAGKLISLDQANTEMTIDTVTRSTDSLAFEIKKMRISFEGEIKDLSLIHI